MNERIKKIRNDSGLSQNAFAKKLSISRSAICKIESGENFPSDQTLALICKEFNVNEDWLINGIGNVYKEKDGTFTELLSEIDDSDDDFIKSLITVYMGLDEDSKKALRKIAKGMSEKYKKQD